MAAIEKHYAPNELAELWGLCPRFIRETFRNHPGVLKLSKAKKRGKRSYTVLRIPESVAVKVHEQLRIAKN